LSLSSALPSLSSSSSSLPSFSSLSLLSLSSSFFESVVSPSSKWGRWAGSSSEETSSSDEEESSSPSSSLYSPNAHHFFYITVDTSSSSMYLRLFSFEAIGLLHRLESYRLQVSAFRFIWIRRGPFQ
jgi:hypothetical protein